MRSKIEAWLLFLSLSLVVSAGSISAKEIALSFDDGPTGDRQLYSAMERSRILVDKMREAGVGQAIFFVNGKNIDDQGSQQLALYARSGHLIGNHTYNHSHLRKVSLETYLADIRRGHEAVKTLPGFVNLYRFPHLREGDTVEARDRIRAELKSLGYRNGYVTVDNYDYFMDYLLREALKKGLSIDYQKLERLYVSTLVEAANFYDQLAQRTLGRSPKHVLLLHENDLAALFIDKLVAGLRDAGWEIVDAGEAYTDPIAAEEPDTLYNGQGRVAALAQVRLGEKVRNPAESEDFLRALFSSEEVFGSNNLAPN